MNKFLSLKFISGSKVAYTTSPKLSSLSPLFSSPSRWIYSESRKPVLLDAAAAVIRELKYLTRDLRTPSYRVVFPAATTSRSFLELQNSKASPCLKQYWRGDGRGAARGKDRPGVRSGLCTLDIYLRPPDTAALLLIRRGTRLRGASRREYVYMHMYMCVRASLT